MSGLSNFLGDLYGDGDDDDNGEHTSAPNKQPPLPPEDRAQQASLDDINESMEALLQAVQLPPDVSPEPTISDDGDITDAPEPQPEVPETPHPVDPAGYEQEMADLLADLEAAAADLPGDDGAPDTTNLGGVEPSPPVDDQARISPPESVEPPVDDDATGDPHPLPPSSLPAAAMDEPATSTDGGSGNGTDEPASPASSVEPPHRWFDDLDDRYQPDRDQPADTVDEPVARPADQSAIDEGSEPTPAIPDPGVGPIAPPDSLIDDEDFDTFDVDIAEMGDDEDPWLESLLTPVVADTDPAGPLTPPPGFTPVSSDEITTSEMSPTDPLDHPKDSTSRDSATVDPQELSRQPSAPDVDTESQDAVPATPAAHETPVGLPHSPVTSYPLGNWELEYDTIVPGRETAAALLPPLGSERSVAAAIDLPKERRTPPRGRRAVDDTENQVVSSSGDRRRRGLRRRTDPKLIDPDVESDTDVGARLLNAPPPQSAPVDLPPPEDTQARPAERRRGLLGRRRNDDPRNPPSAPYSGPRRRFGRRRHHDGRPSDLPRHPSTAEFFGPEPDEDHDPTD